MTPTHPTHHRAHGGRVMSKSPIERAAEACLAYSSGIYGDSGWKWDELTPETRGIWLGYARAVFESIDRDGLAKVLEDHRHQYDRDCGEDFGCICGQVEDYNAPDAPGVGEHQADAILALLTGGES